MATEIPPFAPVDLRRTRRIRPIRNRKQSKNIIIISISSIIIITPVLYSAPSISPPVKSPQPSHEGDEKGGRMTSGYLMEAYSRSQRRRRPLRMLPYSWNSLPSHKVYEQFPHKTHFNQSILRCSRLELLESF